MSFLDSTPRRVNADAGALSEPSVIDPGGSSLREEPHGRYESGAILGKGGMGEVRLVRDLRVGREVALKVMHAGSAATSEEAFRFLREARVQGQLEHPAIAPVYDLGRSPDGALFFTMKRVRGTTMKEVVAALAAGDADMIERFGLRRLLQAFASVCQAVEFAHARGALHRDLKPANVMLGAFGEVTVLDWGLAKLIGHGEGSHEAAVAHAPPRPEGFGTVVLAESEAATRVRSDEQRAPPPPSADELDGARTLEGSMLGTPGYMAPEQAYGQVHALDERTDIYALGAILFELLALQPLHPRESLDVLYASILEGADARPSVRAPARHAPPEFDAICARATATRQVDRYPTVRALRDDVERYLDGDRDLERRRTIAADHARAAAELTERALGPAGADDDRGRAVQEAGRALALDPSNELALRSLVRMLVEPPRALPEEVERSLDEIRRTQLRKNFGDAALNCVGGLLSLPLFALMGVRDWPLFVVLGVLLAASAASFFVLRRRTPGLATQVLQFCLSTAGLGTLGRAFGPLLVLPTLMAVQALSFSLTPFRKHRPIFVIGSLLTVAIPFGLEAFGVLEPSYAFKDGAMTILPHLLWLPEKPTLLALLVLLPMVVVIPVRTLGRTIDTLWALQERLELQAWHLKKLVPDAARRPEAR